MNLSEAARQALTKLHEADMAIIRLQQRLAIFQTARTAYARVLSDELPKQKKTLPINKETVKQ